MDLRCHNRHKWGSKIDVRGTIYDISMGGVCKNVSDAHAKMLLTFAGWELADARAAANAAALVEPATERTKLVGLGPVPLMRMARDLGLSILGKDAVKLADEIIARRKELAENAAREEEERIAVEAAARAAQDEARQAQEYAIERERREAEKAEAEAEAADEDESEVTYERRDGKNIVVAQTQPQDGDELAKEQE